MLFMIRLFFVVLICACSHSAFAQVVVTEYKIKYYGHTDLVECVAFSPDGRTVLSGAWDKKINVYSADSSYLLKTISGHNSAIMNLAFSKARNKPLMIATGSKDFSVKCWDSLGVMTKELVGYNTAVTALAFDFTGKYLYTGSSQQGLNVWDITTGANTKSFSVPNINALACPRGNGIVYVGSNSPNIMIVKLPAGPQPDVLKGHTDAINALEVSATGKYLVSGSSDKTAIVWETATGKILTTLKGHTWKVTSVSISKDEKYIATGSNDGTAKLWELATGKLIASFEGYGYNVRSVSISPDNTKIAVASYERGVTEHGVRVFPTGLIVASKSLVSAKPDSTQKAPATPPAKAPLKK
jgi:WD40 repeat protein